MSFNECGICCCECGDFAPYPFECPKCGTIYLEDGKCDICNVDLVSTFNGFKIVYICNGDKTEIGRRCENWSVEPRDFCECGSSVREVKVEPRFAIYKCSECRRVFFDFENSMKMVDEFPDEKCKLAKKGNYQKIYTYGSNMEFICKCGFRECFNCIHSREIHKLECPKCKREIPLHELFEVFNGTSILENSPKYDSRSYRTLITRRVPKFSLHNSPLHTEKFKEIINSRKLKFIDDYKSRLKLVELIDFGKMARAIVKSRNPVKPEEIDDFNWDICLQLMINDVGNNYINMSELCDIFDRYEEFMRTNNQNLLIGTESVLGRCEFEECGGKIVRFGTKCYCDKCLKSYCEKCAKPLSNSHACRKDDLEMVASYGTSNDDPNGHRPCPFCGILCWREMNCSLMWCKNCHNFFDMITGKKLQKRPMHNADYIAYLQSIGTTLSEETNRFENDGDAWREEGDPQRREINFCGVNVDVEKLIKFSPVLGSLFNMVNHLDALLEGNECFNQLRIDIMRILISEKNHTSKINTLIDQAALKSLLIEDFFEEIVDFNSFAKSLLMKFSTNDKEYKHKHVDIDTLKIIECEVYNLILASYREIPIFGKSIYANAFGKSIKHFLIDHSNGLAVVVQSLLYDDQTYMPDLEIGSKERDKAISIISHMYCQQAFILTYSFSPLVWTSFENDDSIDLNTK